MDPEAIFYFTLLGALLASTAGFAAAWWGATRRARRLEETITRPSALGERLAALEQTLGSLQAELDRMHEGHDFLSRLVADHLAKPLPKRIAP